MLVRWLFMKGVHGVVEGGCCPLRKGESGFFNCDVRTLCCKKVKDFSKSMVCPHGRGEQF